MVVAGVVATATAGADVVAARCSVAPATDGDATARGHGVRRGARAREHRPWWGAELLLQPCPRATGRGYAPGSDLHAHAGVRSASADGGSGPAGAQVRALRCPHPESASADASTSSHQGTGGRISLSLKRNAVCLPASLPPDSPYSESELDPKRPHQTSHPNIESRRRPPPRHRVFGP